MINHYLNYIILWLKVIPILNNLSNSFFILRKNLDIVYIHQMAVLFSDFSNDKIKRSSLNHRERINESEKIDK